MGATSLEQFGEVFAAVYPTCDAEAVADMYEDNAIFAMPDFGYVPGDWSSGNRREDERDLRGNKRHRVDLRRTGDGR